MYEQVKDGFDRWRAYSMTMAKAERLELAAPAKEAAQGVVTAVLEWGEVSVQAPAEFDFDRARKVLRKKLDEVDGHLSQQKSRLDNPAFQAKASVEMKEQIQQRAEELETQRRMLKSQLDLLAEASV
jgi:valyl-tRNA synthetase